MHRPHLHPTASNLTLKAHSYPLLSLLCLHSLQVLFKHVQGLLTPSTILLAETGDSIFNCQKLRLPDGWVDAVINVLWVGKGDGGKDGFTKSHLTRHPPTIQAQWHKNPSHS